VDNSGIRDRSIEQSIIPVQKAVYKLAKAGEELEKDDSKSAAETLSADWLAAFASAGRIIAETPETVAKLDNIVAGIKSTAQAAGSGDVVSAKVGYVAAVEAIEQWVVDAGIAGQLKGL
jgi:hypothetical protein